MGAHWVDKGVTFNHDDDLFLTLTKPNCLGIVLQTILVPDQKTQRQITYIFQFGGLSGPLLGEERELGPLHGSCARLCKIECVPANLCDYIIATGERTGARLSKF